MKAGISIIDETLRDGLQALYCRRLEVSDRIKFIEKAYSLGIHQVTIGYPAASAAEGRILEETLKGVQSKDMEFACCACASSKAQLEKLFKSTEKAQYPIRAMLYESFFPKYLKIRNMILEELIEIVVDNVRIALQSGYTVTFIFEHGVETSQETLTQVCEALVANGVDRFCLADTAGMCDPYRAELVVRRFRAGLDNLTFGKRLDIEWHGHEDRQLGVASALAAHRAGASFVHCCALGVGERVGNVSTEGFISNLVITGDIVQSKLKPSKLLEYSKTA